MVRADEPTDRERVTRLRDLLARTEAINFLIRVFFVRIARFLRIVFLMDTGFLSVSAFLSVFKAVKDLIINF